MFRLFAIFFTLFLLSANVFASKPAPARQDSILIKGTIFNNRVKVKNATVNLYVKNEMVRSLVLKRSNAFQFMIPTNEYCTIEVTAPSYHTKRFIFDTHVNDDVNAIPLFKFDMDIYSQKELEGANVSVLDFPVGIVAYDYKKKRFIHKKKYTKRMKNQHLKMLDEAQKREEKEEKK